MGVSPGGGLQTGTRGAPSRARCNSTPPHGVSAVIVIPPVQNLYGLSRTELIQVAADLDLPPYRGRQLFRHLYRHGQTAFEEMTDLPAALRDELASRFRITHPHVVESSQSGDGAVKLLIELEDGLLTETVAIGSRRDAAGGRSGRAQGDGDASDLTVCVSTQVGCPLACTFCRSGAIPFRRNLTPGEIASQVLLAERAAPDAARGRRNVVYMGMGEPLLNTDNVAASLALLTDSEGFGISPRRITVSTVGLPDEIGRLGAAAPQVGIAISLHAGDDETRGRFMPIGRRHRMPEIFAALEDLPPSNRRITIEYVLLGGENDRPEDARELLRRLHRLTASGIRPHVNLIAFNPWTDPAPGPPHQPGTEQDAERFLARVSAAGFTTTLRRSRGRDVLAACGQLAATPA